MIKYPFFPRNPKSEELENWENLPIEQNRKPKKKLKYLHKITIELIPKKIPVYHVFWFDELGEIILRDVRG